MQNHLTMSKNLQSAVLMILFAGKNWIFDNESGTLEDVFSLDEKMFEVKNRHLNEMQCKSLCAMIEAISQRKTADTCYKVLEGKSKDGWSAGRDTLKIWFTKQRISYKMAQRIDQVWESLGLSPMQLIQDGLEDDNEFPNILDTERAKEDVLIAILGDHANEQLLHGDFWDAATTYSPIGSQSSVGCSSATDTGLSYYNTTINHHAWEHHHKHFKRAQDRLPEKQLNTHVAIKTAIEDVDESCTPRWRGSHMRNNHVAEYEEFLKGVIVTAVAKLRKVLKEKLTVDTDNTPGRKQGAEWARKVKTVSLAAAGDVEEIWALYVQLFETEPEMDNDKLNHLLQFPGGKPVLYAKFRSRTGLCAWDEDASQKFMKENNNMELLSLLWHQCVGVVAIVDKIWMSLRNEGNTPGILIADEVGVRKTALTMGTIAFAIDAYWVQEVAAGRGKPAGVTSSINLSNLCPAPILGESTVLLDGPLRELGGMSAVWLVLGAIVDAQNSQLC
ncbi:hypothetical protein DFH29DRAFT_883952 [Suillus ampliporus]|nr:hypothetical protein DFH29DRAFT_883952 [Suillus ampliporus]